MISANVQLVAGRWLPLLFWMAAIFVVSHQPSQLLPELGAWDILVKKGAHFLAYAVLALLAHRVTSGTQKPYALAFLITVVYATSDEWHQTFVPMRNGTITDILIDCAGGAVVLITRRWQRSC